MSKTSNNSGMIWGVILIGIGVLFLFQNFDFLDIGDIISTFWPLVLVAIGLKMLYDRKSRNEDDEVSYAEVKDEEKELSSDKLTNSNIFGDLNLNVTSSKFSGGSVSNVFGDLRIDLSKAKVIDKSCKLYVSGVFGSVYVKLPDGVVSKIKANTIAGEIRLIDETHDGLFGNLKIEDPKYNESGNRIFVNCSIVFGSITVH
ncbi:cell wall-active antibiotics response protein LiaF [Calditrichota bacterium]